MQAPRAIMQLTAMFARFDYLPRTLRLVWRAAHGATVAWALLLLCEGLLPVAYVFGTQLALDGLTAALAERTPVPQLLLGGGLLLIALVAGELIAYALERVRAIQAEFTRDEVMRLVHQQSAAVDLAFYEAADYYDQLHRARAEAHSRPIDMLERFGSLLRNGVTLLGMALVLLPYGWWVPPVLLISALPALLVARHQQRKLHSWWQATTARRRQSEYYDQLLTSGSDAAELRMLGVAPAFANAYQALRAGLRGEYLALGRAQGQARLAATALAFGLSALAIGAMLLRALAGAASLGELVAFYQAFAYGQGLVRLLLRDAGQLYAGGLYVRNLFAFLDLASQVLDPPDPQPMPHPIRHGIRFRNVSFSFPGSQQPALQHLDLWMPAGQVTALVGANGAGKSTILKLLCRLYDPSEGIIEIDGIDIRQVRVADLRQSLAVLFQLPTRFHATAGETIALGTHQHPDAPAVVAAAEAAGAAAVVAHLPQGYHTLLGKAFGGGTDLSGGEWQRLALARALLRQAPLLLLDEPTSALDPWAEAAWLERFGALAPGQMALIITHRFTTARHANLIYVLEHGQVREQGSHDQLLEGAGLYAQSWYAQADEHAMAEQIA